MDIGTTLRQVIRMTTDKFLSNPHNWKPKMNISETNLIL